MRKESYDQDCKSLFAIKKISYLLSLGLVAPGARFSRLVDPKA